MISAIDEAVRITEGFVIEFFDSSSVERLSKINALKVKFGLINCYGPYCECAKQAMADGANRYVVEDYENNCPHK